MEMDAMIPAQRLSKLRSLCLALGGVLAAAAALADPAPATPEKQPGVVTGYLAPTALFDSAALLPPPPPEGSAPLAMDQAISRDAARLQGSPRWRQAGMDANLSFPWTAGAFSCALDAPITPRDTPHLYELLRRTAADAHAAAHAAKERYNRPRPFLVNKGPTCTPGAEEHLAQEGSYPSTHATIGWIWALLLAEASPDQGQAVLARGQSFGQSRVVCNAHWESDVIEGRVLAAATVARLHADPNFIGDLEAAKAEIGAARAKKLPPLRDCKAEAAALALDPPQAP
jgi:acid phosphatase (class A)